MREGCGLGPYPSQAWVPILSILGTSQVPEQPHRPSSGLGTVFTPSLKLCEMVTSQWSPTVAEVSPRGYSPGHPMEILATHLPLSSVAVKQGEARPLSPVRVPEEACQIE